MKREARRSLARLATLLGRCELPLSLTPREVAKELGLHQQRTDWLIETFRIRSVLLRGRRYVTRTEMQRLMVKTLRH